MKDRHQDCRRNRDERGQFHRDGMMLSRSEDRTRSRPLRGGFVAGWLLQGRYIAHLEAVKTCNRLLTSTIWNGGVFKRKLLP